MNYLMSTSHTLHFATMNFAYYMQPPCYHATMCYLEVRRHHYYRKSITLTLEHNLHRQVTPSLKLVQSNWPFQPLPKANPIPSIQNWSLWRCLFGNVRCTHKIFSKSFNLIIIIQVQVDKLRYNCQNQKCNEKMVKYDDNLGFRRKNIGMNRFEVSFYDYCVHIYQ